MLELESPCGHTQSNFDDLSIAIFESFLDFPYFWLQWRTASAYRIAFAYICYWITPLLSLLIDLSKKKAFTHFDFDFIFFVCFFTHPHTQLKPNILDIIDTYFLPLETDLIPIAPALVVSILPGLLENNEDL